MTAAADTTIALNANIGTEQATDRITSNVRPIVLIAAKARELWRCKVAVELAERAGVSVRSAENYLAGERAMNGNALARLIQSDAGPDFIEALISELPPSRVTAWRIALDKAAERAELRRRLRALESD